MVEDILFNSIYLCKCEKIAFIDYIGNHYIQRGRVTLGTKSYENVFELKLMGCTARENILRHFGIDEKVISSVMGSFYYGALNAAVGTVATEPNLNKSEIIAKMKAFVTQKEVQVVAKKAVKTPLKQRLLAILVRMRMAKMLVELKR